MEGRAGEGLTESRRSQTGPSADPVPAAASPVPQSADPERERELMRMKNEQKRMIEPKEMGGKEGKVIKKYKRREKKRGENERK